MAAMRATAATVLGAAMDGCSLWIITSASPPASQDATTYRQAIPTIGPIPRLIGLPAYQRDGSVRIQKDAVQATAIPTGPQWSPKRKSMAVVANSTKPQRSQRSARPI